MRVLVGCVFLLLCMTGMVLSDSVPVRDGWRVMPTEKPYQTLVDDLKSAIKAEKMLLVTQASASGGAKGRGLTIPGNRVMGVYRNDYAIRMLEASVAAGIEAPIRFYVTENSDGTATLSWKTPGFVFAPYMEEGGEALRELAAELDGVFRTIAENAVASR
ncbi:uncharacterized protein (DUF302 family) [Labrenzia sp. EL_13]|uniref:DUF302 domain-containing protein n=1 Tax=Roseibium album TaxID=311410 RepID=UPI0018CA4711|nr:DUF302 domain-containing protein [Roseibium album]MBG6154388.1 uncharacterized protein (DUF302 family) [Labrenzia sp. EL_162]MBG6193483.1 uncharacterized protein (DUF302 family) [Labrenzia sp. EL_159]MBG6199854.1 uncharacterized protein (DUF302 family) [Labrenzia sp. EL_13]MBG6209334.1 uncharacterized protein (DUF302 family) [Labrenzia sp. EL_126]